MNLHFYRILNFSRYKTITICNFSNFFSIENDQGTPMKRTIISVKFFQLVSSKENDQETCIRMTALYTFLFLSKFFNEYTRKKEIEIGAYERSRVSVYSVASPAPATRPSFVL